MDARDDEDGDDADVASSRGGAWLTYRYRLGGGAAPAHGTIKAPSFLSAARRLVERRLAAQLGEGPAYLRLRAAGEEEVVVRVTPRADGRGAPQLDVVARDAFDFGPTDVDDAAG